MANGRDDRTAQGGLPDDGLEDAVDVAREGRAMAARYGSILATIRAAREVDALLHLTAYCDHPACAARTFTMFVKDYDRTMLDAVEHAGGICCPLCGRPTVLQQVHNPQEEHAAANRDARYSVNVQMYERDHGGIGHPLGLRDDLPPTPPGWWGDRTGKGQ